MQSNRVFEQPDHLLLIVRMPKDWKPKRVYDVPPSGQLISSEPVASFGEALDDLRRCNRIALEFGLDEWAVVQTAKASI